MEKTRKSKEREKDVNEKQLEDGRGFTQRSRETRKNKTTLNKRNREGREEGMPVIWKAKNKGMEGQEIEKAKKLKIPINEERGAEARIIS